MKNHSNSSIMIHMEVPIDKGKFFGTKMTKKKNLGCVATMVVLEHLN